MSSFAGGGRDNTTSYPGGGQRYFFFVSFSFCSAAGSTASGTHLLKRAVGLTVSTALLPKLRPRDCGLRMRCFPHVSLVQG